MTFSVTWLDRQLPWWRSLDVVRQRVIIKMAFNLGSMLGLVQRPMPNALNWRRE
ncbi:hypothetical protein [Mycetohabitans sp. B8]|uniref:hypothetical protein n=1 Tax=Mycetohabitans sp. B8 TaxID=2841845 RepID=UPI001F2FE816|nr:hypothetical protein [Mycetohabitans sp. B8]